MTQSDGPEEPPPHQSEEPALFQHPTWMIGVVLIFAVIAVVAGLDDPVWLLIGSPFIVALALYFWARFRR